MPVLTLIMLLISILYLLGIAISANNRYKIIKKLETNPNIKYYPDLIWYSLILIPMVTINLGKFSSIYIIVSIVLLVIELFLVKIINKTENIKKIFKYELIYHLILVSYIITLTIEFYVRGM